MGPLINNHYMLHYIEHTYNVDCSVSFEETIREDKTLTQGRTCMSGSSHSVKVICSQLLLTTNQDHLRSNVLCMNSLIYFCRKSN